MSDCPSLFRALWRHSAYSDGFPGTLKPAAHQLAPLTAPRVLFAAPHSPHPKRLPECSRYTQLKALTGTPTYPYCQFHNWITPIQLHPPPAPTSLFPSPASLTVQLTTCAECSFCLNLSSLLEDQLNKGRNFHFASWLAQGWHTLALNEHTCDESSGRAHCRVTQQCRTMKVSISI